MQWRIGIESFIRNVQSNELLLMLPYRQLVCHKLARYNQKPKMLLVGTDRIWNVCLNHCVLPLIPSMRQLMPELTEIYSENVYESSVTDNSQQNWLKMDMDGYHEAT